MSEHVQQAHHASFLFPSFLLKQVSSVGAAPLPSHEARDEAAGAHGGSAGEWRIMKQVLASCHTAD